MAGRGRDDAAIAEALGMLAGVLGGNPNVVGLGAARQLSEFQKNNPPMFKGAYDPDGAQTFENEGFRQHLKKELGVDVGDRDFLPFQDIEESVREDMKLLKDSPLIPEDVIISGAVYDVDTGLISEVK